MYSWFCFRFGNCNVCVCMYVCRDGVKEGFPQRQLELGNTMQSEKQLEEAAMEHAEEQRRKLKVSNLCMLSLLEQRPSISDTMQDNNVLLVATTT